MPYTVPVASFADVEEELLERVRRVVWCRAATVDTRGRPRSRAWHPIWEGKIGRIASMRHTLRTGPLDRNPYVSLSYLGDDVWKPVYIDCRADWDDTAAGEQRAWEMFLNTPPPVGYDPARIWNSLENPGFGVLKLEPWRIEIVDAPEESRVCRA